MGVSLLEKQNWYCENNLRKIPIMCGQGWWMAGDFKKQRNFHRDVFETPYIPKNWLELILENSSLNSSYPTIYFKLCLIYTNEGNLNSF